MLLAVRPAVLVAAIAAASFVCPRAFADEGAGEKPAAPAPAAEDPSLKPVRDAFAAMMEAAQARQAAGNDAAKRKEAAEAMSKAQEAFTKAFAASDWKAFDIAKDAALLQPGLSIVGNRAIEAGDGRTAVRAFEMLAESYPQQAAGALLSLASGYLLSGDAAKAREAMDRSAAASDEKYKPWVQVNIGDLLAATGDTEGARKLWQETLAAIPADLDARKDPYRARAKSDAELRIALVGQAAPEIDSKTWLDGEPRALSAMKGSVVIVDFWATWCPPCRGVMPSLNKLAGERKKDGLAVIGVTRFYPKYPGFLPRAGATNLVSDGEKVDGLTPENFMDHLKQFKTNSGIAYPFVVTQGNAEAEKYHVTSIPTMAVIDREGKIAFLKVGGGDESMLRLVVDRLLAPAPAK